MFRIHKTRSRRVEIRKNRPDVGSIWQMLRAPGVMGAVSVAAVFFISATLITTLRERMVRYRPDQHVKQNILSRVQFYHTMPEVEQELRRAARESAPRIYRSIPDNFDALEQTLLTLPETVSRLMPEQLPRELRLDGGTITALSRIHAEKRADYPLLVKKYVSTLRADRDKGALVVLGKEEWTKLAKTPPSTGVRILSSNPAAPSAAVDRTKIYIAPSVATPGPVADNQRADLLQIVLEPARQNFDSPVAAGIAALTIDTLRPTHEMDRQLTEAAQKEAAAKVSLEPARRTFQEDALLVPKGERISAAQWRLLNEEQRAYVERLDTTDRLLSHAGMAGICLLITAALCSYTWLYQPRVIRNRMRALAIAALMLSTFLVAQLAAIGSGPLLLFGTAPTLLVAIILAIAYDQRYAIGLASLHAILVTVSLDQSVGFFLIIWVGVLMACFLMDDLRSRSKLVEVGGLTALAMMLATVAVGLAQEEPMANLGRQALYAGASGLGVGFVVLGILPFIEKAFKITTSMTLLELADISQPLLRRLSIEAPGTYNHSLQVATLAEAGANAIGANALLCRVGSYYHDVGKINKPDYFIENQQDGRNRHINLTPSVSLLIIIGHVKDGIELAKEYNLPPVILPIIQQHHGTTLVEYFYDRACKLSANTPNPDDAQPVSDTQYRYPGPRPQTRETAIVMVADAVESATRAMVEPTASRIETLVHELIMRRLLDGQFDEADLTFQELAIVERTLVKTLLGIYHGRLAYPSSAGTTGAPSTGSTAPGAAVASASATKTA